MLSICAERSLQLRPNIKTHKCAHIAVAQFTGELPLAELSPGACGTMRVCTSTLRESRHFLRGGFGDVLYAVPLAGRTKVEEASRINGPRFAVLVDSVEHVDGLISFSSSSSSPPIPWRVWIKVDCGYGRAGRKPELLGPVVDRIKALGEDKMVLMGFYTHAGHSYRIGTEQQVLESQALAELQAMQFEHDCCVSFGSTPTASRPAEASRYADLQRGSEIHPGNYIFYDRQQMQIGSCTREEIAVCVLATVIGVYPERGTALIDAGSRALGKDMLEKPADSVWADIVGYPALRLNSITQEVGIVSGEGASSLRLGQQLKLLPNHSCLTATNFDEYHVVANFFVDALLGTLQACPRGFE